MGNKSTISATLFLAFCLLVLPGLSSAQMNHGQMGKHGQKMGHHGKGGTPYKGHQKGNKGGHIFGAPWKATLTDDQKNQIDRMHLEVKKGIAPLKALLALKKTELTNLVIQDSVSKKDVNAKIVEIIDVKRQILEIKYSHKIEMRQALTPEQRVTFDLGLIGKSGKKHHKM